MAYAIIRTGGKQYRVCEGDQLRVEKLAGAVGDEIDLEDILALCEGEHLDLNPKLGKGDVVRAKVLRQDRAKKIRLWKFKRRKRYQKRQGHRQAYTEIKITSIPTK